MNNLSQKEKEEILMAYAIKNNYKLYNCGASTNTKSYLCINKSDLENSLFEDRFNLKLKFKNNNIDIYIDDYGMYKATSNNDSSYYKLTLDTSNNNNYRLYSIFDKYKKTDDTDVFYLYQGYYKGNCKKGEKLSLYDFLSGKKVYTNTCNGNNTFTLDIKNKAKYLQLYKYELKKDKNNNFYLAGYNPVKE